MSKISELSDGGNIQDGDTLIAVRSGGNVKVTYDTDNVTFGSVTMSGDMAVDTDTLFVDVSSGSVGIGTTNPSFKLDVVGNARAAYFALSSNETAPSEQAFIYRPSTGVLGFGTGGSSGGERARIDANGNLLVGTTQQLSGGASFAKIQVRHSIACLDLDRTVNGDVVVLRRNDTLVGTISVTTTATAYNTSSDARLKENITDAPQGTVDALQVRSFDWKADGSHQDYGFVAQELEPVAPYAVTKGDTEDDMWSVDYSKLVPMLVKEIQDLKARIATLEAI